MGQGTAAFVFDAAGRLLLLRQGYDRQRWGPPGGRLEAGEDLLHHALPDAVAGARGVARDRLPRIT
jgi:8-oxo-dGTP pyrophosphatase MutT (NUDIX family)